VFALDGGGESNSGAAIAATSFAARGGERVRWSWLCPIQRAFQLQNGSIESENFGKREGDLGEKRESWVRTATTILALEDIGYDAGFTLIVPLMLSFAEKTGTFTIGPSFPLGNVSSR
jgi:hypothetical protein